MRSVRSRRGRSRPLVGRSADAAANEIAASAAEERKSHRRHAPHRLVRRGSPSHHGSRAEGGAFRARERRACRPSMSRVGDGETRPPPRAPRPRPRIPSRHRAKPARPAAYHAAWEERRESDADANRRATGMGVTVLVATGRSGRIRYARRSFDARARGANARPRDARAGDARSPRGRKVVRGQNADGIRIRDARASRTRLGRRPRARPSPNPSTTSPIGGARREATTRGEASERKAKDAARCRATRGDASGETRRAPEPDDEMKTKPTPRQTQEAERGAGDRDCVVVVVPHRVETLRRLEGVRAGAADPAGLIRRIRWTSGARWTRSWRRRWRAPRETEAPGRAEDGV